MELPAGALARGSSSAEEVYVSVGLALSYWEATEDALLALYSTLSRHGNVNNLADYVEARRQKRMKLLRSAIELDVKCIQGDEKTQLLSEIKKIDDLSIMRNKIAHGYVSNLNCKSDDGVLMFGNYLISSLNEIGMPTDRLLNIKYALNSYQIDEWRERVRDSRWKIICIDSDIRMRFQNLRR